MLPANLEDLVEFLEAHPGKNLTCLRACTAGGDVVPVELHHRFKKATGLEITELFGMTEVLSCITNPPFGVKKRGSIGKPVAQTEVRLVDHHDHDVQIGKTGELLIRSPAMLVGYWNDPAPPPTHGAAGCQWQLTLRRRYYCLCGERNHHSRRLGHSH